MLGLLEEVSFKEEAAPSACRTSVQGAAAFIPSVEDRAVHALLPRATLPPPQP